MEKLLYNNKLYVCHEYLLEKDFESAVIEQAPHIFGENSIYIDCLLYTSDAADD